MSLLDIIGVSCFNTSFYFEFVFLERKDEYSYILALSVFKKTLENREPSVIMSDRELALMNAIKMVFPNTTNLLCIWNIEKNYSGVDYDGMCGIRKDLVIHHTNSRTQGVNKSL